MKKINAHNQHPWRLATALMFVVGTLSWNGVTYAQSSSTEQSDENDDVQKTKQVSEALGEEIEPVKVEAIQGRKRPIIVQQETPDVSSDEVEVVATHELKVEIIKPADGGRMQVLLNGESVNPPTAALLLRLIRMQQSVKMQRLDGESDQSVSEAPDYGRSGHPGRMKDRSMQPRGMGMQVRPGENGPGPGNPPESFLGQDMNRRHRDWFTPPVELTTELIDQVMIVIKDFDRLEVYASLTELQANASEEVFSRALQRSAMRWQTEIGLYQKDREGYDLRLEDYQYQSRTFELQYAYRQARDAGNDEDAQMYSDELQIIVGKHFDIRQKQREREVERLMAEVEKLRERVEKRLERRDEIIQNQLNRLLGESNEF